MGKNKNFYFSKTLFFFDIFFQKNVFWIRTGRLQTWSTENAVHTVDDFCCAWLLHSNANDGACEKTQYQQTLPTFLADFRRAFLFRRRIVASSNESISSKVVTRVHLVVGW